MKTFLVAAAAALLVLALAVFLWNRERRLRAGAERRAEAAELALKGQIVETEQTRTQLWTGIQELFDQNTQLHNAYRRALAAAPGARPASASSLDTGPLAVVRPLRPGAERPGPAAAPAPPAIAGPDSAPAPGQSCPECALAYDDRLDVRVDVLELTTRAGNTVAVGTARVSRVGPPSAVLAEGPFRSELSRSGALTPPAPAGWGAGPLGSCSTSGGCQAGVLLAPPPLSVPLLGRVETVVGLEAGPGGLGATAGAWVRW